MPPQTDNVDPDRINNITDLGAALTRLRELAGLSQRQVAKETGIKLSTLSGYYTGRHVPQVNPPDVLQKILRSCGVTEESQLRRWADAVLRVRHRPGRLPAGTPAPYRGLTCYEPEHAEWFYGRESLVESALARLAARGLPLFIVGASGAGKSSLLRAGIIPAVTTGRVPGVHRYLLMSPGEDPCQELAEQFADLADIATDELAAAFADSPENAAAKVRQAIGAAENGESGGILLAVDQFEGLFTNSADKTVHRAFIESVCALAESPKDQRAPIVVAVTMRADSYHQASNHTALANVLEHNQIVVGPMTEDELRQAIVGPADRARLTIEPGLVDLLLRDFLPSGLHVSGSQQDRGVLPMLSHALLVVWEQRHRSQLTVRGYRESGGINRAIAASADEAYGALDADSQNLARMIFLRLVHVDDRTEVTRRRLSLDELGPGGVNAEIAIIIDRFVVRRLLTVDADGVQISHDALIREWPRLRGWLDDDWTGLKIRRQLDNAARDWQESGRDQASLYSGSQLGNARDWAKDSAHVRELTELETAFLDASIARQTAEELAGRRRVRRRWALAGVFVVLALVASVLTGFVVAQRLAAEREQEIAQSVQLAEQADLFRGSDVSLSMQLALAAYRIWPTPQARASLLDSVAVPAGTRMLASHQILQAVAITPNGRVLASGGGDHQIQLWDLTDRRRPSRIGTALTGPTDTVYSMAFSPDGRLMAEGGADRLVRLWNVADPAHPSLLDTLSGPADTVYTVAFSPNGRVLAAGSADNTIHLWDLADQGQSLPPLTGFASYVQSVAFSPDGQTLAAGSADRTVRLWNISDPARPAPVGGPLTGPSAKVLAVTFSPDGHTLAEGGEDRVVRLWNVTDPAHPTSVGAPLAGATGWINAVAFNPDGDQLAVAGSDNVVRLWDVVNAKLVETLPHPGPVTGLAFTDQGRTLATSAADGVVRLWSLPGPLINDRSGPVFSLAYPVSGTILAVSAGRQPSTVELWDTHDQRQPEMVGAPITDPAGDGAYVGSLAVSPDGRIVAIGCLDGSIQLWNVADPRHPDLVGQLVGATQIVESMTYSPDGTVLAAAGDDHVVRLWDVRQPARPRLLSTLTGPANYVYGVTFSSDGRLLAAGSADDKAWLWDVSTPGRPQSLPTLTGFNGYVYATAFSPRGRVLAVGSADRTVRLWDLSDPEHPVSLGAPLTGATNYVYSVAFSPDGRTLIAGVTDHTVLLWDVTVPRQPSLSAVLSAATDSVFVATPAPDGRTLAAGTADQTVRLWTIDPAVAATEVCAAAGDPITPTEWAQYVPDRPYQPPC